METFREAETHFTIREVSDSEFKEIWIRHAKAIFDDQQMIFRARAHLTEDENQKIDFLGKNLGKPFRLNLCAFHNGEFAGWSWGIQESAENFYMVNSAVIPQFRRKGLYSRLLTAMIEAARQQGFQVVYSKHVATNNAILIPKLKAGFIISSFDLSDSFGVLVHLRLYLNPLRRKMMSFRAGELRPDSELRQALKLDASTGTGIAIPTQLVSDTQGTRS